MRNFTKPILILLFTHFLFSLNAQIVSLSSGDWNDASTWVGGTIPQAGNDVTINHAVTVTLNGVNKAVCNDLNISSMGSLNCTGNGNLTIGNNPNGGNNSLAVDGSLMMGGSCQILLRGSIAFGVNASWTMNAGYLEIDGNNGVELNSVADGTALLTLQPTTTKTIIGGTIRFNDPHAVTGNLLIQGTANFLATTIEVGKSLGTATDTDTPFAFDNNITFGDVNVNYVKASSNALSFGMGNSVAGNFSMTNGKLFSSTASKFEGNINCNFPAVIEGDVVCMGAPTLIAGNGDFTTATIQSSIPLASGSIMLDNNLRVGNLMLNNSIELSGATLWVDGYISGSGIITVNGGGALKRNISAGSGFTVFPLGTSSSNYSPVTISNTTATSDWTVSLSPTPRTPPTNTGMVKMEWDITPSVPNTQADINVQWDAADEGVGFNRLASALYHWNSASSSWDRITPNGTPTTTGGNVYSITKTGWSYYSPFAVFSSVSLPVELVSFTGKTQQGKALLTWATASEKNNQGFDIEKSFDGKNFDKIAFVKGNGISTITQNYNFTDHNFNQNAYYRLKQVDMDGTFDYSKTIALNTEGSKNKSVIKSYPNPVSDALTVETSVSETSQLEIIDAIGRVVFKQNVESGNYQIPTSSLVKGIYILRVSNKNDISIQKIIKN